MTERITSSDLLPIDRWMLSRLARAISRIDDAVAEYRFSEYAQIVYELVWWDFCDWYLESIKPTVDSSPAQQAVLRAVLDSILRLLHPVTPFVTEVLHEHLRRRPAGVIEGLALEPCEMLCTASWPHAEPSLVNEQTESRFAHLQAIVGTIRETRAAHSVPPKRKVTLHAEPKLVESISGWDRIIPTLAGLAQVTTAAPPNGSVAFQFETIPCALSGLEDEIDAAEQKGRLAEVIAGLETDIARLEQRLGNPGYTSKAPPHLVEQTRSDLAQKKAELESASRRLRELE